MISSHLHWDQMKFSLDFLVLDLNGNWIGKGFVLVALKRFQINEGLKNLHIGKILVLGELTLQLEADDNMEEVCIQELFLEALG